MIRLLMVISLLFSLPRRTAEEPHRESLRAFQNPKFAAALRVSEVVRIRFTLAAAATHCRHVDNLFGYNLLLSQFSGDQQALIATAVRDGTDRGARTAVAAGDAAACAATLRSLRSADNELVVLAEQVAHGSDSPRP